MVDMVPVSSSNVAAVGYDVDSATLYVSFLDGAEYEYDSVSQDIYEGLLAASSVGGFLDAYVKKAGYSYRRIR
jgi:hypothetical protein